jgi:hypothetical protein
MKCHGKCARGVELYADMDHDGDVKQQGMYIVNNIPRAQIMGKVWDPDESTTLYRFQKRYQTTTTEH